MKTTLAVLNKRGENAAPAIINTLEALSEGQEACFGLISPLMHVIEKDLKKLTRQNISSVVAFGYTSSAPFSQTNIQVINNLNAVLILEGTIYSPNSLLGSSNPKADNCQIVRDFVIETEGDYALIAIESGKLIAARDPIGVQPLYFGENQDWAAVASNRRALWALGIKEVRSFMPGHIAIVTRDYFRIDPVKTLMYSKPEPLGIDAAAKELQRLLEYSVQTRVKGLKEAAVAFSGGLDSSLIAYLAKKHCSHVQLIHVSLENQPETEEAWEAAEALDLPLQVHLFKEKDVEETIPKVVKLIEEPEPLKVNVGVPFYWTAEKVAESKLNVLLAGQGADELFGGYLRYVKEYLRDGDEKVRQTFFSDVIGIYESNLERDEKICNFHDVQLRLPFASYDLVSFALKMPTELKFENKMDSLRKLVLRRVAVNLGIPDCISQKPKKAVQYSTGVSNALQDLAKKKKTTQGGYLEEIFQSLKQGKAEK